MAATPRHKRRVLSALAVVVVAWGAGAYLVLPGLWTYHDRQPGLAAKPMLTVTKQGIHGDPINVGLVGSKTEILDAMAKAGWHPADAITLLSSFEIGESVMLGRAYPAAPISNLYYEGKPQMLAFERAEGRSARRRHHVRFWLTLQKGAEDRPVWLGAASFDRGVGLSRYTLQITHRVAPDLDAERDLLIGDLTRAHLIERIYHVAGIGPTTDGRNGGGDPYFTDGDVTMGVLTPGDQRIAGAPEVLPDPVPVAVKNGIWHTIRDFFARLRLSTGTSSTETMPPDPTAPRDDDGRGIQRRLEGPHGRVPAAETR